MIGAGAVAIGSLVRSEQPNRALVGYAVATLAVAFTVGVQLMLIGREHSPEWWRIPLVVICVGGLVAIPLAQRHASTWFGMVVATLLVAPMVYSFSVWLAPVDGVFPTAGPSSYAGPGGVGVGPVTERAYRGLIHYLRTHGATKPYGLLTQSSDQAAPLILLGFSASAEGGYGASDPALSGDRLARLVAAHEARYLLIGGPYARRGGNSAATAARLVCPEVPQEFWGAGTTSIGSYLVDCRAKAAELRRPYRTARAFLHAHPTVHYSITPAAG